MSFYANDFKFGKMNREKFKQYKKELTEKYKDIHVSLSLPVAFAHNDTLIARFYQDYSAAEHADFGTKTLYLLNEGGEYKILAEVWEESTNGNARSLLTQNHLWLSVSN